MLVEQVPPQSGTCRWFGKRAGSGRFFPGPGQGPDPELVNRLNLDGEEEEEEEEEERQEEEEEEEEEGSAAVEERADFEGEKSGFVRHSLEDDGDDDSVEKEEEEEEFTLTKTRSAVAARSEGFVTVF